MTQPITSPQTVGSLSNIDEFRNWTSDDTPDCDIVEVRLDGFKAEELEEAFRLCLRIKSWSVPILITVRSPCEGGIQSLDTSERCRRLTMFSEVANYADIEIANYPQMEETVHLLKSEGATIILSHHNFSNTPTILDDELALAAAYGADIIKFAVMHNTPADIFKCVEIIESTNSPLSIMGMGELAPVSRVLYAQMGSLLNYGYLGNQPTAPGQWSARRLKDAIEHTQPIN